MVHPHQNLISQKEFNFLVKRRFKQSSQVILTPAILVRVDLSILIKQLSMLSRYSVASHYYDQAQ